MANRNAIRPESSHLADLLGLVKLPKLRAPTVPSDAQALDAVAEMGEFDQLRLKRYQAHVADTVPAPKGEK